VTSGISRAVPVDVAAIVLACCRPYSSERRSGSRELAALSSATLCRCSKTASPPAQHNTTQCAFITTNRYEGGHQGAFIPISSKRSLNSVKNYGRGFYTHADHPCFSLSNLHS